jgi:hypothetical protein
MYNVQHVKSYLKFVKQWPEAAHRTSSHVWKRNQLLDSSSLYASIGYVVTGDIASSVKTQNENPEPPPVIDLRMETVAFTNFTSAQNVVTFQSPSENRQISELFSMLYRPSVRLRDHRKRDLLQIKIM